MRIKVTQLLTGLVINLQAFSQNVSINSTGNAADPTAILDISSPNSGLLVPRVALTAVNVPINAPTKSLLVWNISLSGTYPNEGFHYFDGVDWIRLSTALPAASTDWMLLGNTATNPGTGAGQNYLGTTDAQDLVIASNATEHIRVRANGNILLTGDLENQELTGSVTSLGSPAPTVPALGTYAALGLPTLTGYCASCIPSYGYTSPNSFGSLNSTAHVIDGTVQSVTVEGSGVTNSGVLVLGNVVVKTTSTGSLGVTPRYIIFLQRATDATFTTGLMNLYKIEDMPGAAASTINAVAGAATSTLIFPDLGLAAGTYYYRLVFSGLLGGTNGQTPAIADRSMTLLQIKR